MGSKYISFTSGHKSDTGNEFSDMDFVLPFDAAFVYFGDFSLRMRSFDYISPSGLKSDIIFDFSAPFSYKVVVISGM